MRRILEAVRPDLTRVGIVMADKNRLCEYTCYLPPLMDALTHQEADPDCIRIFIACGTHGRQGDAESRAARGDVYGRFAFIHHDAGDGSEFTLLGETARETPVCVRKDLLECTCVMTFGAISHHYFAGYGGGRKLIFPGLGFKDAVNHNHALFLDRENRRLAPTCRAGILDANPVAEDLEAYESFFPAVMAIHGILDRRGRVFDRVVGTGSEDFRSACAAHGRHCKVSVKEQYPWVLASCGGHPGDINFIQRHKAVLPHAGLLVGV
jgi:nickel-dependent lactate racemase